MGSEVCRRWQLGYAPGRGQLVAELRRRGFTPAEMIAADLAVERQGRINDRFYERVMFPIHDEQGRTIGFGGRVLTDAKPKYLNTKETRVFHKSKNLFGIDRAKAALTSTGTALVVEGYTDVIALHEHGFENAVAALGTALSLDHVKTLSRYDVRRIVCMFDGDAAGQKAAELSVQYVDKTDAEMLCVVLPGGQDPMEFLSEHEPAELQEILDHARPLVEFVLDRKLAGYDLGVPGQRASALAAAAEVLAPLLGSVSFDGYATALAHQLDTDLEATKGAVREAGRRVAAREAAAARQAAAGGGTSGSSAGGAVPGGYDGYAPEPWEDGAPVEEYAPQGEVPPFDETAAAAVLSLDAREQLSAERELLALLASDPEAVRPFDERLGAVLWADSRHETMCWAMLSAPDGATPAQVVAAASAAVPEAPRLLSSGGLALARNMDAQHKAAFLVDVLELYSTRREIRQIQGRLRGREGEDTRALLARALELRQRETELNHRIPSEV